MESRGSSQHTVTGRAARERNGLGSGSSEAGTRDGGPRLAGHRYEREGVVGASWRRTIEVVGDETATLAWNRRGRHIDSIGGFGGCWPARSLPSARIASADIKRALPPHDGPCRRF